MPVESSISSEQDSIGTMLGSAFQVEDNFFVITTSLVILGYTF